MRDLLRYLHATPALCALNWLSLAGKGVDVTHTNEGLPVTCPAWCVLPVRPEPGGDHRVHRSASLRVGPMLMRLCLSTSAADGVSPFILVGQRRYTLWEAEALIDALTQLVDSGLGVTPRAGA